MARATYTLTCDICNVFVRETTRKSEADARCYCTSTECRLAVTRAHNAEVIAHKALLAERAAERKANPRPARVLYGDYAQLAALSGIRKDGTGRRAR